MVSPNADRAVKREIHQCARVEAVSPQRTMGFTLADSDPDGNESGSESSLGYRWIEPAKRCRICIDLLPGVADSRLDLRRALTVRRARALRFPSTSYSHSASRATEPRISRTMIGLVLA